MNVHVYPRREHAGKVYHKNGIDLFGVIRAAKHYMYISIAGTIGLMGTIPASLNGANLTENAAKLVFDTNKIDKRFLAIIGNGISVQNQIRSLTHAVGVPKLALERIKMLRFPLPPLATQQAIVAEIEAEQALVAANRELIARFEQKIQATLARVWGEEVERG
jgi:type I restriction enzyme M protein